MIKINTTFHRVKAGLTLMLLIGLQSMHVLSGQVITPAATAEAENGVLSGSVVISKATAGYSGTGYVTGFVNGHPADKVTVTMNVSTKGMYLLKIRYHSDIKTQDLFVNGSGPSQVIFPQTTVFTDVDAGKYLLNIGTNTFTIQSNWGYIDIDKFSLFAVPKNTYSITPDLVNPNADEPTRSLYAFLLSKFNSKIISGQTDNWFENIKSITGKTPMVRAFDFQHYTQGYAYLWDNTTNGFTFGVDDNGQVQKAIDWYNATNKVGIVGFQWHWHSPSGGTLGTNTFSTANTTFDVTKAVIPGTPENKLILQDIDTIAYQLKRLQTAGVPVLWRPLHEAGGTWFWWGAKGSTACKQLYQIMFDRMITYHGLTNLIWVWSTPETDWYPGNSLVDIVGDDSYPGNYVYDPQKSAFDGLFTLTGGHKLIAMSENGPIPNPDDCLQNDAPWSYFMSWSDLAGSQNTNQHLSDVFQNPNVLTIENPTPIKEVLNNTAVYKVYPNPAQTVITLEGDNFSQLEIIDLNGKVVYQTTSPDKTIPIQNLADGLYLMKIIHNNNVSQLKLLIRK